MCECGISDCWDCSLDDCINDHTFIERSKENFYFSDFHEILEQSEENLIELKVPIEVNEEKGIRKHVINLRDDWNWGTDSGKGCSGPKRHGSSTVECWYTGCFL